MFLTYHLVLLTFLSQAVCDNTYWPGNCTVNNGDCEDRCDTNYYQTKIRCICSIGNVRNKTFCQINAVVYTDGNEIKLEDKIYAIEMPKNRYSLHIYRFLTHLKVMAVEADPEQRRIFFAKYGNGYSIFGYVSVYYPRNSEMKILQNVPGIANAIGFDRKRRHLYCAIESPGSLSVITDIDAAESKMKKLLDLKYPKSIAIDHNQRYIFVADWGRYSTKWSGASILRYDLENKKQLQLITTNIKWPNAITVDGKSTKLIWGDAWLTRIEAANLDGTERRTIHSIPCTHINAMTVVNDSLYWTDGERIVVMSPSSVAVYLRHQIRDIKGYFTPADVKHMVAGTPQKTLPTSTTNTSSSYTSISTCYHRHCSSYTGKCEERKSSRCLCDRRLPNGVCLPKSLIYYQSGPQLNFLVDAEASFRIENKRYWQVTAVANDYLKKRYFYAVSEWRHSFIEEVHLDGFKRVLLEINETVNGLTYHNGSLFMATDLSTSVIKNVDASSIEVTLIARNNLYAVVVDPDQKYLFAVSWGWLYQERWTDGVIIRYNLPKHLNIDVKTLDHDNIVDQVGLRWPAGLIIDPKSGRIIWGDAYYDKIESVRYDGSQRKVISHIPCSHISSMILLDGYLFWTDIQNRAIKKTSVADGVTSIFQRVRDQPHVISYFSPYDDGKTREVKISDVTLAQQSEQQVHFNWTFNFPTASIYSMEIDYSSYNGTNNITYPLFQFKDGNWTTNAIYIHRLSVALLPDNVISYLFQLKVTDEGDYRLKLKLNNFGSELVTTTRLIVTAPPMLNQTHQVIYARRNESVILPCTVVEGSSRYQVLSFVWFKKGDGGAFQPITGVMKRTGGYSLKVTSAVDSSAGEYQCRVWNNEGNDTMVVMVHMSNKPVLINPPLNRSILQDIGTTEFNCQADGNPAVDRYHWYVSSPSPVNEIKQNTTVIKIENNGKRLKFINPGRNDATFYYCAGENIVGIGEAKGAYLNVTYPPGDISFENERNGIVKANPNTNFTVKCSSDANPPAVYTWYRKVQNWRGEYEEIPLNSYSGHLHLLNVLSNDTGIYICKAENSPNPKLPNRKYAVRRDLQIMIRFPPVMLPPIPPGRDVREGATVSMECHAEGKPAPKVYWQKYGENITKTDPVITKEYKIVSPEKTENQKTRITSKLTFNGIRYTDTGGYSCILYNAVGNINTTATFVVQYVPRITKGPENSTGREGTNEKVRFVCEAIAHPNVTSWQWFFNGVLTSETSNTFVRRLPDKKDNGVYTCRSRNTIGFSDNATAYLKVEYTPKITKFPEDVTINQDGAERIEFLCEAESDPQVTGWQWYHNGNLTQEKTNVFSISSPMKSDSGRYTCRGYNNLGFGENATAYLVVQSNSPSEHHSQLSSSSIVGIVFAVIVVLIIIGVFVHLYVRRKQVMQIGKYKRHELDDDLNSL